MGSKYSASARNRQVVFQRATSTDDGYGGQIETWADYCTEWATVSFGTGQERREAAQQSASAPATFMVLANSLTRSISVTDRISFDGSVWDITSAVPSMERNVGIDITAIRSAR